MFNLGITGEMFLYAAGAAFIALAVFGGGLKFKGVEIPALSSVPRQLILGILGIFLVVAGIFIHAPADQSTSTDQNIGATDDSNPDGSSDSRETTAAGESSPTGNSTDASSSTDK